MVKLLLLLCLSAVYILHKTLEYRKLVGKRKGSYITLFHPYSIISYLLPQIRGVFEAANRRFPLKRQRYEHFGWDILSNYCILSSSLTVSIADANVIKDVLTSHSRFPRYLEQYKPLSFFGPSVLSTEGDEWKKYKKIVKPAFTDKNIRMGWNETVRVMNDLFEEEWGAKDVVNVSSSLDLSLSMALYVLSAAIFGQRLSWKEDEVPKTNEITFKKAVFDVSSNLLVKIALPSWTGKVSKRLQGIHDSFNKLDEYMLEMVQSRDKADETDLFSSLMKENANGDEETALSVREIIGNVFVLLEAGHEGNQTAAHTFCFAFLLLALYPQEQQVLFEEVRGLLPDGRDPIYEEMHLFTQAMAVYYETLRMFPPVTWIPKVCAEDTILVAPSVDGNRTEMVPIPKGTNVVVDVVGVHYNPRHWEDPTEFRPSRFVKGDWNRDAFIPFSAGSHACIGRKFFEVEAIAILVTLIRKYKIELVPESEREGWEEKKRRVLACTTSITLTPANVPVVFRRRDL
ncbi:cytochrome P450 [Marasmius fiardii PR-910]|nr:cytochrome P450 [Marasmius fiardii PR-910]